MKKMPLLMLLMIFTSIPVFAGEKRIVHGAQTAADGSTYEVGFCARGQDATGSKPGHAFVVLQSFDKNKERTEFLTAGFGPPKSVPVHQYGLISPENYSDPTQDCLVAETNKDKYQKIRQGIQDQKEFLFAGVKIRLTRPYTVVLDDCVTFLQAIATDFGLVVPSRQEGWMPLSFVQALKAAN